MIIRFFICLLLVLQFFSCSREYRILEIIHPDKNDYRMYIVPVKNTSADSIAKEGKPLIEQPLLIDNSNTLKMMKHDWVLNESTVPKAKAIGYKIILYHHKNPIMTTWLDENFSILIWQDRLLRFDKSLIFNYQDAFKYLPDYSVQVDDVTSARRLHTALDSAGTLIISNGRPDYWQKFDGNYRIRRPKNNLKPIPQIGQLREKIKNDFPEQDFYLIGYEFDEDTDSMTVSIASDSVFIDRLPQSYHVTGSFTPFHNIGFRCIGLEKSVIEQIAATNKISDFRIKSSG